MKILEFNDYFADIMPAVLWQYDQSVNILNLLQQKQIWYDINQSEFWRNIYTESIFNLSTKNPTAFGMSIWSIILNVALFVSLENESPTKPIFGFNAFNPSYPDLINSYGNFFGTTSTTQGYNFSTAHKTIELNPFEQQFLLRLRYYQLTTRGSIAAAPMYTGQTVQTSNNYIVGINNFLNYLITNNQIGYTGKLYVLDGLDMSMTYVFTANDFPPYLFQALRDLDIFPRPAGVKIKLISNHNSDSWGFGLYHQNFENGNLVPYDI